MLYYERIDDICTANKREKQLKNWHRDWKLNLIKKENPNLEDLAEDWFTEEEIRNAKGMYFLVKFEGIQGDSETSSE